MCSVSYTHLDVYKRQVYGLELKLLILQLIHVNKYKFHPKLIRFLLDMILQVHNTVKIFKYLESRFGVFSKKSMALTPK